MSLPLLGRSIQSRVSSGTVVFQPATSAGTQQENVVFSRPFAQVPAVLAMRNASLSASGFVEVAVEAVTETSFQIHVSYLNQVGEISVSYIACG